MSDLKLADTIAIAKQEVKTSSLPKGYRIDETLGLAVHATMSGQVIHVNTRGKGMFETRAEIMPNGDYLLMFPDGGHYVACKTKNNDMLAYRSKDKGLTWAYQGVAFDIDYNQHGFVPLVPRGSKRVYAFGTQPVWGLWNPEGGLGENAPIGYRYSDDNGYHWSEVRIIRPANDPGYLGMSVMRMCETDAGTWLLGSHEGDWSYKPLMTRQYILRSEDQGQTWNILPNPSHGGWCVPFYNRMDEGRPINLGGGKVFCMIRTCEGHLWGTWSEDDGNTWSAPEPTALVHPDAPPMLFLLSDGKTLAALHHNRHSVSSGVYKGLGANPEAFMDRSEVWVAFSTDGGHTWDEPHFVCANALAPSFDKAFRNYQCSYLDMFMQDGICHLFMPHRWERALHLTISEDNLRSLSTRSDLHL